MRRTVSFDINKLMQQAQQMQSQMAQAQEEVANEIVEASAGGGMVKVKVSGALEVKELVIDPEAIDPEDPELLQDTIIAAVNEGLRSAQSLMEQRMGGMMGGLGGLGLPGL
jgi:DNA-binding YbaB/EbfC family protein